MNQKNNSLSQDHQDKLIVMAPAKINLHLEVLGIRTDRFHELAMVMQSINLFDYLEISNNIDGEIKLFSDHPSLELGQDNLINRAANLLLSKVDIGNLSANIRLLKKIPIGAGLAGGSTDAAAALVGLNSFWQLGFSLSELELFSEELGSDVPFCVRGGRQLCFGRGEKLERLKITKPSYGVILVKDPSVNVSTPWAYNLYKDKFKHKYLYKEESFEQRRSSLRKMNWLVNSTNAVCPPLVNDLENVVAPATKSVRLALEILESLPGCLNSAMSGSGPSCFGLFRDDSTAKEVLKDNQILFKELGFDVWACEMESSGANIKI